MCPKLADATDVSVLNWLAQSLGFFWDLLLSLGTIFVVFGIAFVCQTSVLIGCELSCGRELNFQYFIFRYATDESSSG